jgi:phosphoglycolate phosphatase
MLEKLAARDDLLLGVATGKSRRGLDKLLDGHELRGIFVTTQVADHHPSKPHPAMLQAALDETGMETAHAVMIGDTTFDMDMARAAGITGIGVEWGYHPAGDLDCAYMLRGWSDLGGCLDRIWRMPA